MTKEEIAAIVMVRAMNPSQDYRTIPPEEFDVLGNPGGPLGVWVPSRFYYLRLPDRDRSGGLIPFAEFDPGEFADE